MSFSSRDLVISSPQAHLTTSAPFRVGQSPYPASYAGRPAEGPAMGVPVSCCLSAAGIGFMVILCPLGSWAFLTVGLPVLEPRDRTPTGLPRCAPMRCGRVGCPLYPEDCGTHTVGGIHQPPHAAFQRPVPIPRCYDPSPGLTLTRHHRGFTDVHPSGLPLVCDHRMERRSLDLNPELHTPPLPAAHVGAGTGI